MAAQSHHVGKIIIAAGFWVWSAVWAQPEPDSASNVKSPIVLSGELRAEQSVEQRVEQRVKQRDELKAEAQSKLNVDPSYTPNTDSKSKSNPDPLRLVVPSPPPLSEPASVLVSVPAPVPVSVSLPVLNQDANVAPVASLANDIPTSSPETKVQPTQPAIIVEWQALLSRLRNSAGMSDRDKLIEINNFFNKLKWVSDDKHWGVTDYWATPLETLISGAGDCEDFAIGKYFSLREAGIASDKLRIHYVKALDINQAHMVLGYYSSPGAEPLILDNLDKKIKPASQRGNLLPIYSFDVDGLWLARSRSQNPIGKASSLRAWEDTKRRMSQGK